jgi:hypothetical protein
MIAWEQLTTQRPDDWIELSGAERQMVRNDFQPHKNIVPKLSLSPTINAIELELRAAITLEAVANECHLQSFAINHRWVTQRQERCYSVMFCTQ